VELQAKQRLHLNHHRHKLLARQLQAMPHHYLPKRRYNLGPTRPLDAQQSVENLHRVLHRISQERPALVQTQRGKIKIDQRNQGVNPRPKVESPLLKIHPVYLKDWIVVT